MTRINHRNFRMTAALAALLTVPVASAQQPMIVYMNGQPMLLTPMQATPATPSAQAAVYPPAPLPMMPAYIAPQAQQPQLQPPQGSSPYGAFPQYVGQGAGVANGQLRRMSLPTGSPVYVRLISSISSNRLVPGAPFEASLDAPLEVNGVIIAERGARAEGRISESDAAGKISGQSRVALQLTVASASWK